MNLLEILNFYKGSLLSHYNLNQFFKMKMNFVRLLPRYTVGSRQAEHELQGESIEEDDMVKSRYGNTLYGDEPMREERVASPRSL